MRNQGNKALEVLSKFEIFQCVPNQDTYTFTLQAIFNTRNSDDILQQGTTSISQKMFLHL